MTKATRQAGLDRLNARVREDLSYLTLPAKSWVPRQTHKGQAVRDVVIIGAGMCGLAALAQLQLAGIDNSVAYDHAPQGLEGPWITFARMKSLRSPKTLTGPALGLPALTFRAWFTAQFGADEWDRLGKIPKEQWMEYLVWYRRILDLPIENGVRLLDIEAAAEDLVALRLEDKAGTRTEFARHLVLATGRSGLGGAYVPDFLDGLDPTLWAHGADDIDFAALKGKDVAVIGAGATAMDNAGTALEHGAASLSMLIRRKEMPQINKMTGIGSPGVVHGIRYLPDEWKWKFYDYVAKAQTPPPRSSTLRVSRHPNARFYLDCAVAGVRAAGSRVIVETSQVPFEVDFVIAATGFRNDFFDRAEFASIASHIKVWGDGVYTPEMGTAHRFLVDSPYLGESFEFLEKEPGACPLLSRIHCFNDAAMLSHGKLSGDIPAVSAGADRLMRGIAASLFNADREEQFKALQNFATPELEGDEWTDSTPGLKSKNKIAS
ncbi:MAG: NAD(P)/FAD-dependent oxidoreductase [Rhodospirillaceae bacterium]|nr:NAD(P)/FAD-dependent oxidoreductase [Rhodospirillaceae bacterium]MDD9927178.1 NAD(P)/FAD-dependent oxidoreductase [Rhodospirillaceae bacterium]